MHTRWDGVELLCDRMEMTENVKDENGFVFIPLSSAYSHPRYRKGRSSITYDHVDFAM
jgi:hypothetical protein